MKGGSFNDRVEKCIARFHDVEIRSNGRGERHGIQTNGRSLQKAKEPPRKA
jgi:hypothetical protein